MMRNWHWPNDAPCAISLTYDDGNPGNLNHAIPQLEARNLRGTFYLDTGRQIIRDRAGDWRIAHQRGHEIGSHSVHHPCRLREHPQRSQWMTRALDDYTPESIAAELDEAAAWLDQHIGPDPERTYAYPCCDTGIGDPPDEAAYDAAVLRHHFAARIGGEQVNLPGRTQLLRVCSFCARYPTFESLISPCQRAAEQRGWTVIMFHGTGDGGSLSTDPGLHEAFLDHISQAGCWIATFKEVARYLQQHGGATDEPTPA